MYKDVLRAIAGIETFPIVSLVLFVATFTLAVVWALRLDRATVTRLASLPFDDAAVPDTEHSAPGTRHPAPTSTPHSPLSTPHFREVSRGQ